MSSAVAKKEVEGRTPPWHLLQDDQRIPDVDVPRVQKANKLGPNYHVIDLTRPATPRNQLDTDEYLNQRFSIQLRDASQK